MLSSKAMKEEVTRLLTPRIDELRNLPEDQLRNEKIKAFVNASVRYSFP